VNDSGSELQAYGPATENAHSPVANSLINVFGLSVMFLLSSESVVLYAQLFVI